MTTLPPQVHLHPLDERALVWRFSDDWRGDVGLRSNFGAMAAVLALGTRVQTSLVIREWGLEDDAPALVAARRVRAIDRRLARLQPFHVRVLRGAYSPRGPLRPEELSPWKHRLSDSVEIGGVLLVTPAAIAAHADACTPQTLARWLACVSAEASQEGLPRARRREIEALVGRLTDAASRALLDAHAAWRASR